MMAGKDKLNKISTCINPFWSNSDTSGKIKQKNSMFKGWEQRNYKGHLLQASTDQWVICISLYQTFLSRVMSQPINHSHSHYKTNWEQHLLQGRNVNCVTVFFVIYILLSIIYILLSTDNLVYTQIVIWESSY